MPEPSLLPPISGLYAGAIATALVGALGVLWRALRAAEKRADEVSERRIDDARATVSALSAAQSSLDSLTSRVGGVEQLIQRMVDRERT